MEILETLECPVWRILPLDLIPTPTAAARAPEGRFHHSSKVAAYASLSPEGAVVAIQRYLNDNTTRKMVPMRLKANCVVDVRGNTEASVVWQDMRAENLPPPTWKISDAARELGAKAMLYSSRSRPYLSHVVVFDPNCLRFVGPVTSFGS